jgi:hypothetical protein
MKRAKVLTSASTFPHLCPCRPVQVGQASLRRSRDRGPRAVLGGLGSLRRVSGLHLLEYHETGIGGTFKSRIHDE